MRKNLLLILILIVVLFGPVCANAQRRASPPKEPDATERALREKAYALLELLAGQLGTMQSGENRARIGSNLAWSLWSHNEARAREVLGAVQQDINAGLQAPQSEDNEDVHTLMVFMKLRADTVERIAQRDPELAFQFFKATALSPNLKLSDEARASEEALESQLAKQVAADNPELALQLGRKLLARGFSEDVIAVIRKLNRKHKDSAAALYKDAIEKLAGADLPNDWQVRSFALNLANSFSPPQVSEADFTDLINQFLKAAVDNGCMKKISEDDPHSGICRSLLPATALIAKVNPTRAKELERWKVGGEDYYWQPSLYYEIEEVAADGTVEDLLALAAKYPESANEIRWRAFRKAQDSGDTETARKIVTDGNLDQQWKERMMAELDEATSLESITDEMMSQLQKRLTEIKKPDRQVIYLTAISSTLGQKDRKFALKLLNQANQIVDTMKPGGEQTMARVALALVYCQFKDDRGFTIMEALLPKLNELIDASAKLDGYERRYLRDGEWNMSAAGHVGELLTGLAQQAGYFAWCDFDRAVTLTGQFERPEIRIMAQLKLAQGILAGPPKVVPFSQYGYQ